MASIEPTQSSIKVVVATGTSATGATTTKSLSLFSASLQKASLTSEGIDAAGDLVELLEPLLNYTLFAVNYTTTSALTLS